MCFSEIIGKTFSILQTPQLFGVKAAIIENGILGSTLRFLGCEEVFCEQISAAIQGMLKSPWIDMCIYNIDFCVRKLVDQKNVCM